MIAFFFHSTRAGSIFAQGDYINKNFPRQVIITRVSLKSAHTHIETSDESPLCACICTM